MKLQISRTIASLLYLGFVPGMPGTYSSIITALVFYWIHSSSGRISSEIHLASVGLITLAGIFASAEISRRTGNEDPSYIVIDEAAGQLLTFLLVPVSAWNVFLGILAFRTFDIWKPYPIRKLERLGKGVGVMADDLLAGIYANVALQIINLLL
ncbi:MAG: phosphatidylglycerophosphatase A [Acidobacteria bacterium]|nr:phosphatidylglycerophosphatase A [Acidobacteriota bacterium]